jgi:protein gp37
MGDNSAIEWTTHTWNPWIGCTEVSPGCDHCYARELARRYGWASWGKGAERHRTSAAMWRQPVLWNRTAATSGDRVFVFCASLADFFDPEVPDDWRRDAWDVVRQTPWLTWQILTKRPNLILRFLPPDWGEGWPNVWLGTSVEDQRNTWRIGKLLQVPAAVRFLSCEPLLGPVDIRWCLEPEQYDRVDQSAGLGLPLIHWVICGGESSPHARPMHPDWARSLRDQCVAAGAPFLFKQWGEHRPVAPDRLASVPSDTRLVMDEREGSVFMVRVGKRAAGRLLDGRTWDEMPEVRHAR